ncbi:hypothetical protein CLOM_g15530 [Closterium sp. NIES-68]|nr:hypothetical protein CLOM_g15530 [Closterium sp. NIES-68]
MARLSKSGVDDGRPAAKQALSVGGSRVVSLLVGPDRTPFLCSASLLSRHSPFLASLLSDRWTAVAGQSSANGAEAAAMEEESGDRDGGAAVDSYELKSVDAGDFSRVMLLLAYKELQSHPKLRSDDLATLRSTLDFLEVDMGIHLPPASQDGCSNGNGDKTPRNDADAPCSPTSFPFISSPPLVRQLRPAPVVPMPRGYQDPLLFESNGSNFRLNLCHYAIRCTLCPTLKSGQLCSHGRLWTLIDQFQQKVVQPDLCDARLSLYTKVRAMYDDPHAGAVQIRRALRNQSLVLPITLPEGSSLHCPSCQSRHYLVYFYMPLTWCADCGKKWEPKTFADMACLFHVAVEQAKELLEACIHLYASR